MKIAHSSWGSGWPNCQPSKIDQSFQVTGTEFPGGVRHELVELVTMLVQETKDRGYRFGTDDDPSYGCWGYSCRAISGSNTPSNHSWGLAVDINAPSNPYTSPIVTDMPPWMPQLWEEYGFRWGGNYSGDKDAMHYEFMGSVADAAHQTERARNNGIGGGKPILPPPIQGGNVPLYVKRTPDGVDWAWADDMSFVMRIPTQSYYANLQYLGIVGTPHGEAERCEYNIIDWLKGQVAARGGSVYEPPQ